MWDTKRLRRSRRGIADNIWGWVVLGGFLLVGASQAPKLARGMAKAWGEWRKARAEVDKEIKAIEAGTAGPSD